MRAAPRLKNVIGLSLVLFVPAALLLVRPSLRAGQVPAAAVAAVAQAAGGDSPEAGNEQPPKVYFRAPVTTEAATTWMKLQKKIPMPFPNETPLEEILRYVAAATSDEGPAAKVEAGAKPKGGIIFYVDPLGLQEAEKTITSPITIDVEGIPLATSLRLALRQLGLSYRVQDDGLVVIENADAARSVDTDATALVLDSLAQLRAEVGRLNREIAIIRHAR